MRDTVSGVGDSIQVGRGVVSSTDDGIRFGGSYVFSARGAERTRVEIAVWDGTSSELDLILHEGDTFHISGQTWRLDEIHSEGGRDWYAELTRVS